MHLGGHIFLNQRVIFHAQVVGKTGELVTLGIADARHAHVQLTTGQIGPDAGAGHYLGVKLAAGAALELVDHIRVNAAPLSKWK
jgi:hypothetical protein